MKRILIILALLFLTGSVMGQIPRLINYQGMLFTSTGQPVADGQYNLTFTIYDDAGTALWTETQSSVFIGGGNLHVMIGASQPLTLAFDKPYFLGIKIGTDSELQPRMPLTTSAYSFNSGLVNGIGASQTPAPHALFPLGSDSKFPESVLPAVASGDFIKRGTPDTSRATSTSPMLLVSNLGDGDGINGRSTNGFGIAGQSTANDGITGWTGASGKSGLLGTSSEGRGVTGRSEKDDGIVGWTDASDKSGVFGHSTDGIGITGQSSNRVGVNGRSDNDDGVAGWTGGSDKSGVFGHSTAGYGVSGQSSSNIGVIGTSVDGVGVSAISTNFNGIQARSYSNTHAALAAGNEAAGPGIYIKGGTDGTAAIFKGNIEVRSLSTDAVIIELGEGLDYAEGFAMTDNTEIAPGTVVSIDPDHPGKLAMCNQAYDQKVAGIVAGARGLGSGVRLGVDTFDCDVALAGRVFCNVDATEQEVRPGDLLTTSTEPGYAMVAMDPTRAAGAILGKAMEPLQKGNKGQILVLVSLQ